MTVPPYIYGIPAGVWRYIDRTTEKTIETNYLSELSRALSSQFVVTIIGPSRAKESDVGFDAIMAGLPPGYVLALQFKKPSIRKDGYPRFTLDVSQLQVLLDRFSRNEAFFVLAPFTRTTGFIIAHRNGDFVRETALVDIFDIPFGRKTSQRSRTIRYIAHNRTQVTDPRRYIEIERTRSLSEIVSSVMEGRMGKKVPVEQRVERPNREKRRYGGPNFYLHISRRG